jgi:MFS family permease
MGSWFIVFLILTRSPTGSALCSAAAMFIMSVTGAIGNVEFGTYLTENIADDMIGKVSGVSYSMTIGACALGPVIGGYAVQSSSAQDAISILFIIVALMALASLLVFKESPSLIRVEPEPRPLPAQGGPVELWVAAALASAGIASLDWTDSGTEIDMRDGAIMPGGNSFQVTTSRPSSTIEW